MKTVDLTPGSSEWLQSRSASKAATVMGASKYQTRGDLLKQMATGITKEVDAGTQARFDDGHRTEALAREIAEEILGDDLSPISGATDDGYLTANFDGLTFDGLRAWEHKLWNEELAAAVRAGEIPATHYWQLEQHIIVGKLESVLFMVSDGTREKCVSMEYRAVPGRAAQLLAGWKQFDVDLATYEHVEVIPAAVAAPTMALPALSIQVNGSISLIDNLELFGRKLTDFIATLPVKPETDQQFADADAAVKTLKTAEDALDAAESSALAQTASIDQMRRTVGLYRDQARTARLMLDKMVKARKETIRLEIAQKAKDTFTAFVADLNKKIGKPYLVVAIPDFLGAMKGMKKVDSCREAVDGLMAQAKIAANETAGQILENMTSLRELAMDHAFLFADAQALVTSNGNAALVAIIKNRIADHQAAEAKRLDEERQRIAKEERAKIEREQGEKAAAEAKVLADKASAEEARQKKVDDAASDKPMAPIIAAEIAARKALPAASPLHLAKTRPTDGEIISALCLHFRVHESKVIEWLCELDLDDATERMAREFAA